MEEGGGSSSGGGGRQAESSTNASSGGGNSGSTSGGGNHRQAGDADGVPAYVDMVIPDYGDTSSGEQAQKTKTNKRILSDRGDSNSASPAANGSGESLEGTSDNNTSTAQDTQNSNDADEEEGNAQDEGEEDEEEEEDDSPSEAPQHERRGLHQEESAETVHEPSDTDVILNGDSSEHPGNQRYQALVRHLSKKYTKTKLGYRQAAIQILLDAVKVQGGRFMKATSEGNWKEVSDRKALRKASDALRGTSRSLAMSKQSRSRKAKHSSSRNNNNSSSRHHQKRTSTSSTSKPTNSSADNKPSSSSNKKKKQANKSSRSKDKKGNLEVLSLRLQTRDENLKHLELELASMDLEYIFPLAKALDSNDILQSMDIQLASMSQTNTNALAWGIKRCKSLKQIKLHYGKMSEEKSTIVFCGVLGNESIESLNLDDNNIGSATMKKYCGLISNSNSCQLRRLSLENNPFGDEGAQALAGLIDSHRALRYLNLRSNKLNQEGVDMLTQAALNRKDCLFEITGLEVDPTASRKRSLSDDDDDDDTEGPRRKQRRFVSQSDILPNLEDLDQEVWKEDSTKADSAEDTPSSNANDESDEPPTSSGNDGSDDGVAPSSSANGTDDAPSTSAGSSEN
jgi:hypothetical protein